MKIYNNIFQRIISAEHLFLAWDAFASDKSKKRDVQEFQRHLEGHIFRLHRELRDKTYAHSPYTGFYINDPKRRHIHKAIIRDRVLHHAIFNVVNPIFEETFISKSFSCRVGFGTHKGVEALATMVRKVSGNGTRQCFVLKCDVRRFFDSVRHEHLLSILKQRIGDEDAMALLAKIIDSFCIECYSRKRERERVQRCVHRGLPLGNLTSQLFANIYMNEFDQFVKHVLHVTHYARYTDDFVIVSEDRDYLERLLPPIAAFLKEKLALELHPQKVTIRKLHQGVDFLGYVVFRKHRLVRATTVRRIFVKFAQRVAEYRAGTIAQWTFEHSLESYLGVFSHAESKHLKEALLNLLL